MTTDYRLTFPVASLDEGLGGIAALRAGIDARNALGDPRDANGVIVTRDPDAAMDTPPPDVWYGRPGSAASSYTDPNGAVVEVPAKGDPALYYVHIRSEQAVAFDPAQHGMRDADAVASAAVLGIWLGDEEPI